MTEPVRGPRRHQADANRTLESITLLASLAPQALTDWGQWRSVLKGWADGSGFPSGGGGRGGEGGHSDPTARAALQSDQTALELIASDADFRALQGAIKHALSLADSLARRRAWVVNPAKPEEKPHLLFCENAKCQERIREEEGERPREGQCPRCARWLSRYGRPYPLREVVRRGAG